MAKKNKAKISLGKPIKLKPSQFYKSRKTYDRQDEKIKTKKLY